MKSHILSKAFALLALAAAPALADSAPMYEAPLTDDDQLSLACVDVDFGYMTDLDNNLSVDHLYGGTISIGYTFNATKTSYHKLGFKVGMYDGSDKNGVYIEDITDYGYGYITDYSSSVGEKFTQQILPVILEYSYHHAICDDLFVSLGMRAGINISKTTMTRGQYLTGNSWEQIGYQSGSEFSHIEENHTRISPVVGIDLGMEYNISENWKWNAGVNLDFSTSMMKEQSYHNMHRTGSQVKNVDVITTTIHTGFSYSF